MGSTEEQRRASGEPDAPPSSLVLEAFVRRTLERLRARWLGRQAPDGAWTRTARGEATSEAEYVLLRTWLGDEDVETERCGARLLDEQGADGGWPAQDAGPTDLNATVRAYFALKLLGRAETSEALRRARQAIAERGGWERVDLLTRCWLAAWGQVDYAACEFVPAELLFGPRGNPWRVERWGAGGRPLLAAMSIVGAHRPVRRPSPGRGLDELRADAQRLAPRGAESTRSVGERSYRSEARWRNLAAGCLRPWRSRALRHATEWLLERFVASDGPGASFRGLAWSWLALTCRDFDRRQPEWRCCEEQLRESLVREGATSRVTPRRTTVRDTADVLAALVASGVSIDEPRVRAGLEWLMRKEVVRRGEAASRSTVSASGWFRERYNEFYPDVETTAAVLTALGGQFGRAREAAGDGVLTAHSRDGDEACLSVAAASRLGVAAAESTAELAVLTYGRVTGLGEALRYAARWDRAATTFARGREWLRSKQNADGGWGRYDERGPGDRRPRSPLEDSLDLRDASESGATGDVLRLLGGMDETCHESAIGRAVAFLTRRQRSDGSWCDERDRGDSRGPGCTVRTTARALAGLLAVGRTSNEANVRRAVEWLAARQSADGRWQGSDGDDAAGCTAVVVSALVGILGRDHAAVRRAVDWLATTAADDRGSADDVGVLHALGDWANATRDG